jgi:hypothetical protein
LLEDPTCPDSWCIGRIILLHKDDDTSNPANFRPIAITSVIGKLFHRIIARRLESFLLENEVIDPSVQKGFLSGMSGVYEHIFTVSTIIENAKKHGLPVCITFLDLRNAFGSISHRLIVVNRGFPHPKRCIPRRYIVTNNIPLGIQSNSTAS